MNRSGKRKKTRRRRKLGSGAIVSKPTNNNTHKQNNSGNGCGGIEIKNNSSQNDIEYITLYNIIKAREWNDEYLENTHQSNELMFASSFTLS